MRADGPGSRQAIHGASSLTTVRDDDERSEDDVVELPAREFDRPCQRTAVAAGVQGRFK